MQWFSGLRLIDLRLPEAFLSACPGPAFGVDGTRQAADVAAGPLIGTIVKPSVGLTAAETAGWSPGFVPRASTSSRMTSCRRMARAVMAVINAHAERTGKRVMYAFNPTGEVDEMRTHHDLVVEPGGTCVMASMNSVGLTGMLALRRHSRVSIHAHRRGRGYRSRHPGLGFDYRAWSVFWRLAGTDHLHVSGIASKF